MVGFFVEWICLYCVWILFTGKGGTAEFIVGASASLVGTVASRRIRKNPENRFAFVPKCFAQGWRLPWYALSGTVELLRVLYRQIFTAKGAESVLRAAKFDVGSEKDPRDRSRRALATVYTCSTPNFVVLGIDKKKKVMIFHLVESGEIVDKMTRNLGASG